MGFAVRRSAEAYAAYDGRKTVIIGTADILDDDDSVPQLILHELCHSAVEGEDALELPDFGLCNESAAHRVREQACLRLQAALLGPFGLRATFAPTTEHRSFYHGLPPAPLVGEGAAERLARAGRYRLSRYPYAPHLEAVLYETYETLKRHGGRARSARGALLPHAEGGVAHHASGLRMPAGVPASTCSGCLWWQNGDARKGRCTRANGASIDGASPSCEWFEEKPSCQACGACCREGYDVVELAPGEALVQARHPALVYDGDRIQLPRPAGTCVALKSLGERSVACAVYAQRPASCRDFEVGGRHCLAARQRCGLSP